MSAKSSTRRKRSERPRSLPGRGGGRDPRHRRRDAKGGVEPRAGSALAGTWNRGRLRCAAAAAGAARPPAAAAAARHAEAPQFRLASRPDRAASRAGAYRIERDRPGLDILARFGDPALPRGFCDDWVGVAAEEAEHFALLAGRLAALGAAYGDL